MGRHGHENGKDGSEIMSDSGHLEAKKMFLHSLNSILKVNFKSHT